MKINKLTISCLGVLLITACAPATPPQPTPDVNAIRTSAAYTVVAEFTLTAAVIPTTPLLPTETPTLEPPPPTDEPIDLALVTPGTEVPCNDYSFDAATVDVTIPDGTPMTPGQEFVKTWKIRNTGTCAWGDGYGLIYAYGERMNGKPAPLGVLVEVGQEVEISVNFTAPTKIGAYTSAWQMQNPQGFPFGQAIFVKITVQ